MTDWRPDKLARRLPNLQARTRLQVAMRRWFATEGFAEVETPILQVAPGAEVHLTGFATDWKLPDGEERERWLHSSPELAMKKLLAGGIERLFQFARVFRNAEGSALHHPEFTMLEWYRAGAGYETIMEDCAALGDPGGRFLPGQSTISVGVIGGGTARRMAVMAWQRACRLGVPPTAAIGAAITLVYAIHIEEPVFMLPQLAALLIYARNLYFVQREKRAKAGA